MAAISHVFTLARVAQMLGEDSTPAFTDFGIENLRQIIDIHRENDAEPSAKTENDRAQ